MCSHFQFQSRDGSAGPVLRDAAAGVSDISGIVYLLGLDGINAVSLFSYVCVMAASHCAIDGPIESRI